MSLQENIADFYNTILTVFPTMVNAEKGLFIFFEWARICKCNDMLKAVASLQMIYYVFDVQYPTELANTLNFLDVNVDKIDKRGKIQLTIQRKLTILLA